MPTYTYLCDACGNEFERFVSISRMHEPEAEPCPTCKLTSHIRKVISSKSTYAFMAPDQLGLKKPPTDWCNWLSALKRSNKGSDFNTFR